MAGFTDPTDHTSARGGAPVGQLDELPTLEIVAITFFRLWCDGGAHRERLERDLALALGPADAVTAVALFDDLMRTTLACARRPLVRHGVPCRCFGGDESAFANMLAAAVIGDRDEAMLFASILISGQGAWPAVTLAQTIAPYLLRFVRAAQGSGGTMGLVTHISQPGIRH